MTGWRLGILTRAGLGLALGAVAVAVAASTFQEPAGAQSFPTSTDVETYRDNVETVFMEDRGGTTSGIASCVMCHTWQTSIRFSLETPETAAGWTSDQSQRNLDVVGQLINTADPASSRLLLKPLSGDAGGLPHTGGTFWTSTDDPEYGRLLQWIQRLPDDQFIPAPEPGAARRRVSDRPEAVNVSTYVAYVTRSPSAADEVAVVAVSVLSRSPTESVAVASPSPAASRAVPW